MRGTTLPTPQEVAERLAGIDYFVWKKMLILGKGRKFLRHLRNGSRDANSVKFEFHSATGVRSGRNGRWLDKRNQFPMTYENVETFCNLFEELTKENEK